MVGLNKNEDEIQHIEIKSVLNEEDAPRFLLRVKRSPVNLD